MCEMIPGETLTFANLMSRVKEQQKKFRSTLLRIGDALKKIINNGINNIPKDFYDSTVEGTEIKIPVHYLADIKKPRTPDNEGRSYRVYLQWSNGKWIFKEIEDISR